MNLTRIALLADGIFAITMTILVLHISVPVVANEKLASDLGGEIFKLWPEFLSFCGSFIILGIYWVAHYTQLAQIKIQNPMFLWMNIFFLMWISLLPFSSALLGTYPGQPVSLLVYGTNLLLCSLSLYLNWVYASRKNRLIDSEITQSVKRTMNLRALAEVMFYLVGVALTFVDVRLAIVAFIVPPILSFIPVLAQASERWRLRIS